MQFVDGARNSAHKFMYPEYFGRVVLVASLGELDLFFTELDMLADAKSDCRSISESITLDGAMPVAL